jgi:WD40 repeat protein
MFSSMSDVFVSYSRVDRDVVARIVDTLRAAGESVWVDLEGIEPSALWMEEIKTAIAAADSVVIFLSPDSAVSEVCGQELAHAVQLQKRIVPVVIRETPIASVPAPLPDINWHFVRPETFDADVGRLIEILNTDIARVHQHTRLLVRGTEWEARGDSSLLLRGAQLTEAEEWLAGQTDQKPTTTPVQVRFIAASRRGATRRQRGWAVAAVAITTILAVIAGIAIVQWRVATQQRNVATSRQLAAEAQNVLPSDPQLSLILALRAYDASPTTAAQGAIRAAVRLSTVRAILPTKLTPGGASDYVVVGMRAFDASGENVVMTSNRAVAVWNWSASTADSPRKPVTLDVPAQLGDVMGAEFRADNHVVFATREGGVFEWDWTAGSSLEAARRVASVGRNPRLGPGGTVVATVDLNQTDMVTLSSVGPGPRWTKRIAVGKSVQHIGFSPDGRLLGTSGAGQVAVWSTYTGERMAAMPLGASDGGPLGFSPNNRLLAVGDADSVKVVNIDRPQDVATLTIEMPVGLPAHCCDVDEPTALVWSPDGAALAAATTDRTIRVWVGGASTPLYLNGDTYAAGGVAFSPDGKHLVSGGTHPEVWDWAAGSPVEYSGHFSPPVLSPDGKTAAVADENANAALVGAHSWSMRRLTRGIPLAFSPDGQLVAVEDGGGISVWNVDSAKPIGRMPAANPEFASIPGYVMPAFRAQFDSTGSTLAVVDNTERPATLLRWQWNSSAPAEQLKGDYGDDGVQVLLGWAPDGTIHYIAESRLESWDGDNPPQVLAALPEPTYAIGHAQYLSAEKLLYTVGAGTRLWDLGDKTVHEVLPDYGSQQFALSGDQAMLAISAENGYVNMWDLRPDDSPIEVGRYDVAPHLAANHDGSRLAICDYPGLRIVSTSFAAPFSKVLELARGLVARPLTEDEQATYLAS